MKKFSSLLMVLTLGFAFATAYAQDSSAVTGEVVDATGAAISGAVVVLTNPGRGLSYTQTTDNTGTYHFLNVPPGAGYIETVNHAGFTKVSISDIYLTVGTTRTQNAKMAAGAAAEISVSASSAEVTLNTTDASIGSSLDVSTLNHIPVQDRTNGITTLFNLQPGVVDTQLDSTSSDQSGSVTGARTDQTSVTVDGLDVGDISVGSTFTIVATAPVDSIEQFTGTVAGLTAGLGTGSGGQFQLVTKHGTNQFHGNINEYHRDTSTASNTYFNKNLPAGSVQPRTKLIRNQFGGNVGGPILKDKLFFFFDFADSRIIQSSSIEQTVPIATFDSATPTLNYINTSDPSCDGTARLNNAGASCISSISLADSKNYDPTHQGFNTNLLTYIAGRYPKPNDPTGGDGVNTEGLRFSYPTPNFDTTYVGRIDYNLSSNHKLFGRFTINRLNEVYPTADGAPQFLGDPPGLQEVDRSYSYVISDIWTIGNNKVNQFYYGDSISKVNFPAGDFQTSPNVYTFTGLSNPYGTQNSQVRRTPVPIVRDDFNWQVKNHSLTMGGLFKFVKTNSNNINNFNFVAVGATGNRLGQGLPSTMQPLDLNGDPTAVADYNDLFATSLGLIGDISTNFNYDKNGATIAAGLGSPRAYRFFQTELYFGDSWKVNKQLTLTYGLRYQVYSVPYEVHGEQSVGQLVGLGQRKSTFDQYFGNRLTENATGNLNPVLPYFEEVLGGKANHGPSSYAQSNKDFAPRLAFAYNPSFAHKTVLNGSAAITYDRTIINAINNLQDQLSFLFQNSNTNQLGSVTATNQRINSTTLGYDPTLLPSSASIAPGYIPYLDPVYGPVGLQNGQEGFVIDPNLKDPYSIDLNLGVQQELPLHMVLRANYVARLGRRLLADADASQILNFPDNTSGQNLSQAFAGLTGEMRSNAATYTVQPWFENVVGYAANTNPNGNPYNQGPCTSQAWPDFLYGPGVAPAFTDCTSLVAAVVGQYGVIGDLGDGIPFGLSSLGLLPNNVAMPAQFAGNAYLTNKGSSNYHGMLLTLSKNVSQGLKFDVNYTLSHAIDNVSQTANNNAYFNATGIICDVTHPRACRGNADFDVRHVITSDFEYDLPFGHNRMFLGDSGVILNELIGGWSISGIVSHRSGLPINVLSDAFISSFAAEDPAIFTGSKSDLASLKSHVNNVHGTVYNFAGGAAGAAKAFSFFRGPLGLEYGSRNLLHGPSATNLDLGLAKIFAIIPSREINLIFRADAFNILNHPNFANPGGSSPDIIDNASPFGKISSTISPAGQAGDIRVGQFSLRLEF